MWSIAMTVTAALCFVGTAGLASATTSSSRVVMLGDSVPYGSACNCTPFGVTYARVLAQHLQRNVSTSNFARSGATTASLKAQLSEGSLQSVIRGATTVLIMVGANDFASTFSSDQQGQCPENCYDSLAQSTKLAVADIVATVQHIHQSPVSIILLDYWNIEKDGAVARQQYDSAGITKSLNATSYANDAIYAAAVARHVGFESTRDTLRGPNDDTDPTPDLASDGEHPDAQGHQLIANMLAKARPRG
jgi:acyl-CoA thioesterase-1